MPIPSKIRFTVPFIRGLRADPTKELVFFDGRVPGFGVRVKPSGVKTYFLQYRNKTGKQHKISIGPVETPERRDGLSPKDALNKAVMARGAILEGKDPAAEIAGNRNAKTVSQLCDEHLKASANRLKPSTLTMEKVRIDTHIKPLLGSKAVVSLKPADIEKFQSDVDAGKTAKKITDGKRPRGGIAKGGRAVAIRTVETLSAILDRPVRDGTLPSNPAHKVKWRQNKALKPPFSFDAVKSVGKAMRELEAEGEPVVGLRAVRHLILTGFRRMECLTLKWPMVDPATHSARLEDTKTGPQMRPLGKAALDRLEGFRPAKGKGYIFPGTGKAGHFVALPKVWGRVAKRAGVTKVSVHGLRHWFSSAGSALNYSDEIIGPIIGHARRGVTGRYANAPHSFLIAAADEISGRLADALDAK